MQPHNFVAKQATFTIQEKLPIVQMSGKFLVQ